MAVMSHRGLKLGDRRRVLAAVTKAAVSNFGRLTNPWAPALGIQRRGRTLAVMNRGHGYVEAPLTRP